MRTVPPTPGGIQEAAEAIRHGDVVAYPTETVYGLAVDPFSSQALERLFEAKGRDRGNPVLLVVANDEQLREVVAEISPASMACIRAFWPGPLSLLFEPSARLPRELLGGRDRVCVRQTSSSVARDLCLAVGSAITSTSANWSGEPAARCLSQVTLAGIAVGIDGGELEPSAPSTVFDADRGIIVRLGAVTRETIEEVTGEKYENCCRK